MKGADDFFKSKFLRCPECGVQMEYVDMSEGHIPEHLEGEVPDDKLEADVGGN